VIIGTPTFGKANVQTVAPLNDMGAISLTVAEYYTPAGHSIHEHGVDPDLVVEDEDVQLETALDILEIIKSM